MPRTTQLIASGKIEIKEIEFLSSGPGEAIVEVQHAGICGTDLALFQGDYPVPLPHVCGHEFIGRVKSVGDGTDKKWVGKTTQRSVPLLIARLDARKKVISTSSTQAATQRIAVGQH